MSGRRHKIEESGIHDGFPYIIIGMNMGHRCGYVGLATTKRTGKIIDVVDFVEVKLPMEFDPELHLNVHGGITYNGTNEEFDKIIGSSIEVNWLGFDCMHAGDAVDMALMEELADPKFIELKKEFPPLNNDIVRTFEYVKEETLNMISQIKTAVGL